MLYANYFSMCPANTCISRKLEGRKEVEGGYSRVTSWVSGSLMAHKASAENNENLNPLEIPSTPDG